MCVNLPLSQDWDEASAKITDQRLVIAIDRSVNTFPPILAIFERCKNLEKSAMQRTCNVIAT